jgi:hypothetical protein
VYVLLWYFRKSRSVYILTTVVIRPAVQKMLNSCQLLVLTKLEKLENILKHSKNRKFEGVHNINTEFWKHGGQKLKEALLKLFNT